MDDASRVPRIRRLLLTLALAALVALPASATAALVVPDGGARISGGTYQREMDVGQGRRPALGERGRVVVEPAALARGPLGPTGRAGPRGARSRARSPTRTRSA